MTGSKSNSGAVLGERSADEVLVAKRLLIIGLDGATFTILKPLMAAGKMPHLRSVMESGASGPLRSTTPALTPAAWTTFLTGKQPGTHGIIDFEQYDSLTNTFKMNTACCGDHSPTIWKILGDRGLKVGSVNVPMTYPPVPVNGFMVSGFETPGPESDFVYPQELRDELLSRWADPTCGKNWRRKTFGGLAQFRRNVDYMSQSFHQGADMTIWLGDKHGWDVLMVVLKLVDNLQHKTWKHLDPRFAHRDKKKREIAFAAFEALDVAVGKLLDYAAENEAAVMIVSDHGHGSLEGKVHPNALLQRWGYLHSKPGTGAGARSQNVRQAGRLERVLPLDLSKTRAAVMHAGIGGFLYFNLKGRQPTGIVEPSDYEALRDELIARFLGEECQARNPQGESVSLFSEVHRPEEVYGCSREAQPWLPDLILIPQPSLCVVRRLRGDTVVKWFSYRRMEGTHRQDGIFLTAGPGIGHQEDVRAHIVDCAPTALAMIGQSIPEDFEGRVITEAFTEPPLIKTASVTAETVTPGLSGQPAPEAYSEDDLKKVTERLSDLGYLE